jgi:single-strand DNA-binding protein
MFETPLAIAGRLVTDVTRHTLANGSVKCSFRMLSNERRFNRDTQEWVDGNKLFLTVVCWRRLAENVAASLFRGDGVVVTGRLYQREFESNGEQKQVLELEARAVGPDLSWCTAMVQRSAREGTPGDDLATLSATAA